MIIVIYIYEDLDHGSFAVVITGLTGFLRMALLELTYSLLCLRTFSNLSLLQEQSNGICMQRCLILSVVRLVQCRCSWNCFDFVCFPQKMLKCLENLMVEAAIALGALIRVIF